MNDIEHCNGDEHGDAVEADESLVGDDVAGPSLAKLGGSIHTTDDDHDRRDHRTGQHDPPSR